MPDRRRRFATAAAVAALGVVVAACSLAWLVLRDDRLPVAPSEVVLPQGSSLRDIARILEGDRIVSSALALTLYIRVRAGGEPIQAAAYDFAPHMTIAQVARTLEAGGHTPFVWFTIPEGLTAAQIGQRLAHQGIVSAGDFARAARGSEGYLFPQTYQIVRGSGASDIVRLFTRQFRDELPPDYRAAAARLGMTVPQVVTIASMVEGEAKVDDERPLIAGVIYNRLRLRMPLEIDATIEYALPRHKTALSLGDLAIASPYNTYEHAGLPPTPICNPGKASLDAAFHPKPSPYLYYVYKGGGRHAFSRTLAEQQANERRYLH